MDPQRRKPCPAPWRRWSSSLEIPAGSTVALVGESGGGKSSLVVLLVGLISPSQGWILADGLELEQIELDSWQRAIGGGESGRAAAHRQHPREHRCLAAGGG